MLFKSRKLEQTTVGSRVREAVGRDLIDSTVAQVKKFRTNLESGIASLQAVKEQNNAVVRVTQERADAIIARKNQENADLDAKMKEARALLALLPTPPEER